MSARITLMSGEVVERAGIFKDGSYVPLMIKSCKECRKHKSRFSFVDCRLICTVMENEICAENEKERERMLENLEFDQATRIKRRMNNYHRGKDRR